jgi:hypothetical protein
MSFFTMTVAAACDLFMTGDYATSEGGTACKSFPAPEPICEYYLTSAWRRAFSKCVPRHTDYLT